jgi:hypothetical protein
MDMQRLIEQLKSLQLEQLRHVQAHVNELIARLEAQGEQSRTSEDSASYQAYRDMKEHGPEDLGQK